MKKKWDIRIPQILAVPIFFIVLLFAVFKTSAQECPALVSPVDGTTLVPADTSISWEAVTGVPGYIISLGTTTGGNDILNERNVGTATTFTLETGLPESTEIFITITLFFFNQPNIVCDSQSFTTAALSEVPQCVLSTFPANDALDVNSTTNISWSAAPSATGYFLSLGTTLNGSEILTSTDVGNSLNYNPPIDLPSEAEIYVTIIPYNRIGVASNCSTFMFTTAPEAVLPICTTMISPVDGETNVQLSPTLDWNPVPNATGYRVSIGTSPFETNILEDAIFFKTSTVIIDFEPNRTFFISIFPFNDAGEAIGCAQETFSTALGCGPYFDPLSGELLVLNPILTFPDSVSICIGNEFDVITATDEADGYRWFQLDERGNETLISTSSEVSINEEGEYIYEAYLNIEDSEQTFECASSKTFQVEISQAPEIEDVKVQISANSLNYEVITTTNGNYEYALDNENGPFQNSNRFNNISLQNHTVYVRDKAGCGIAERLIEQDLTVNGFPNFFTPNGDGINDFWQFIPPVETGENNVSVIFIFDKFGSLLAQIAPNTTGWNGNLNGKALPESNYWFKAIATNNKIIKGHFNLKR
ncbi:T9SS type B sorting domain-containing protein [Maribacter sp. 1_MG-2023]|uniref:T9SS type B sorting domain-containing protein n=1 Tax=Maribacter sp. 1_MG-2023 TaxID=3062677 RepID=UPI0026E23E40|nr:T9SS type B sorting domain-containing protein [Maribacter sp. 1_MG-2023]MDO6470546.1 T9SS type B sorting domain-containing protein [Maribacter sp. 1_MG-2023]